MFSDDDFDAKTKKLRPRVLDNRTVPDLSDYIEGLKAEIIRAEADIAKKEKSRAAADAIFGGKS